MIIPTLALVSLAEPVSGLTLPRASISRPGEQSVASTRAVPCEPQVEPVAPPSAVSVSNSSWGDSHDGDDGQVSNITPEPNSPETAKTQDTDTAVKEPASSVSPRGQAAEIVVRARGHNPADPVEAVNVKSFQVVQAVDKAVIEPVATAYKRRVPTPIRSSLHNILNNLDEPIVIVNFLLQLKPGKAFETLGRLAINTTIGVAGVVDVAKRPPFNLPRRSNGLADTLGYYGVKPGPYLFLPVIGATTLRDLVARPFDLLILPAIVGKPFNKPGVALAKGALNALDERVNFDEDLRKLREESDDSYSAVREYYLNKRRAEIDYLRGKGRKDVNPDFEWKVKPTRQTNDIREPKPFPGDAQSRSCLPVWEKPAAP